MFASAENLALGERRLVADGGGFYGYTSERAAKSCHNDEDLWRHLKAV